MNQKGHNVQIQGRCTLQSCDIGDNVLIGFGSVICAGARIGSDVIIGPNSVIPPGRFIPAHQVWAGNPVKYVRDIEKPELWDMKNHIRNQIGLSIEHRYEYLPYNTAYLQKEGGEEEEMAIDQLGGDLRPEELHYSSSRNY